MLCLEKKGSCYNQQQETMDNEVLFIYLLDGMMIRGSGF